MSENQIGNPLVRQPWYYEYIYPESNIKAAEAVERLIYEFQPGDKLRILDVGCGTGKILAPLFEEGHECVGIDSSQPMIDYAKVLHPHLRLELGDMRTFDLGEQFDVVLCAGSTFTNNLTNADVHLSLANFRKHCKIGGLLILGMLNASRFLGAETFSERLDMRVDEGEFHATAFSRHLLDKRRQSFRRVRTWRIDGQDEPVVDDAEFRLFFPLEIEDYVTQHSFSFIGLWDNSDMIETDLSDRRLYVAARAV
jgi:SAM-dependent methyltransferase